MNIPIVMVSAKKATYEKIDGFKAGCDAYIEKPFEVSYLLSVIDRLMDKNRQNEEYYNSTASSFSYSDGKILHYEDREDLEKINAFISSNIQSQINVPELAAHMNLSVRQLYRRFTDLKLPPPNEYIKSCRLSNAAKLLVMTSRTIQEIMYDSGFSSKAHFYKEFDKAYGMTPKEYRHAHPSNPAHDNNV